MLRVDPKNPQPDLMRLAGDAIRRGELVAFPTETVYGIAADAFNPEAVSRVYEVKGRPSGKPLPVQVSSKSDIEKLAVDIPEVGWKLIDNFFPGPLTIVMWASSDIPNLVTAGTGKVGIRMPDHQVALELIREAGTPIVAPSANVSDMPPATTAEEVLKYFDGMIEVLLDAGPANLMVASTVIDVTETPPKILRQGSLDITRLEPFLT